MKSPDINGTVYAHSYNLLALDNRSQASYHGVQLKDPVVFMQNLNGVAYEPNVAPRPEKKYAAAESGSPAWYPQFLANQVQSQRAVYVYPVEYNVYGMESSPELSYQFNKTTRAWEKRYKIYDYIGNLRIIAKSSGLVLEKHCYTAS